MEEVGVEERKRLGEGPWHSGFVPVNLWAACEEKWCRGGEVRVLRESKAYRIDAFDFMGSL